MKNRGLSQREWIPSRAMRAVTTAAAGLYFLACFSVAHAENELQLVSPEQGWMVNLSAPALIESEQSSSYGRYRFYGKSKDGFFLSLHVEPTSSDIISSDACRSRYFGRGRDLPDIIDTSSMSYESGHVSAVHYNAVIEYRSREFTMPNTHYFFMINGFCADLHMGATPNYNRKQDMSFSYVVEGIKQSMDIAVSQQALFDLK